MNVINGRALLMNKKRRMNSPFFIIVYTMGFLIVLLTIKDVHHEKHRNDYNNAWNIGI